MLLRLFIALSVGLLFSCNSVPKNMENNSKLKIGPWRATLQLAEGVQLPFNFDVSDAGHIYIRNANERIKVTEIKYKENQEIEIFLPVFGTYFTAKFYGDSLRGYWIDPNKVDYKIPFFAQYDRKERFANNETAPAFDANGKWEVTFSPDSAGAYQALGVFEQKGKQLIGTFLTETGDYRYLEGQIDGEKLYLSCFDGAHAFLFEATGDHKKIKNGTFWSGKHWSEPWIASRNDSFQLPDPDTLTHIKAGYDQLYFSFLNELGDSVRLSDEQFKNKVVIVQIMGSWCPNCMDETAFLVDLYKKYKSKGLEIIAIDYELRNDIEVFKRNIARLRKDLGVDYVCLFGGPAKKSEANKTLPMLNHILSYPTTIFIDKKGAIRKIQTGFSGPGTGDYYDNYVQKTTELIETLLD